VELNEIIEECVALAEDCGTCFDEAKFAWVARKDHLHALQVLEALRLVAPYLAS
jgi:bacterioferritin-associated ferredoxin